MGWTLTRASTGVVVWQEAITSKRTATVSDAFTGMTRLKMATEGAAKKITWLWASPGSFCYHFDKNISLRNADLR